MATVETSTIRGLNIDKIAKGFAEREYMFKSLVTVSSTDADEIRWYSKTAGTLSATAPQSLLSSPLSTPATLEVEWTRNTSYVKQWSVEGFISDRDMKVADVDVWMTTVSDLTRAVVAQVDAHIYDVITESLTPVNIQTFATTAVGGDQWDAASDAGNPIKDILRCHKLVADYDYETSGAVLVLNPQGYEALAQWVLAKGAQFPGFTSGKVESGTMTRFLNTTIKVSNNVGSDYGVFMIPQKSTTFRQLSPLTAVAIEEKLIGKKIRIREEGVAYNTDPKAIVLITDILT